MQSETLRDWFGKDPLKGVGVGVPGFILFDEGIILGANNLPAFEHYPMRAEIEKRLGSRVLLENDANAAALGEKWMGAGRGVDDLVLLTLGTGIGGGIIIGGRVMRGHLGMAGELGHMTVIPNGNLLRLRKYRVPGKACLGHRDFRDGPPNRARPESHLRRRL